MIPKFTGKIIKGRIYFDEPDIYEVWIGSLDEQRIELVVKKEEKERTDKQNRYLWGVVYKLISESTGYSTAEVHELMRSILLKDHKDVNKKRYTVLKSTTSLNTAEFVKYIDEVKMWASMELGLYIPDADKFE